MQKYASRCSFSFPVDYSVAWSMKMNYHQGKDVMWNWLLPCEINGGNMFDGNTRWRGYQFLKLA